MCRGNDTDKKMRNTFPQTPDLPIPKNKTRDIQYDVPDVPVIKQPGPKTMMANGPKLKDYQTNFITKLQPAAEKVAAELNVPAEAVLAQLAYENGWGRSSLASKYNNYGGLKTGSAWKGKSVKLPTKEKNKTETETASFRAYDTPEDYADDMITFLSKKRYKNVPGAEDSYQYALRLGLAGYHQDTPEVYADEIERIAQQIRGSMT